MTCIPVVNDMHAKVGFGSEEDLGTLNINPKFSL